MCLSFPQSFHPAQVRQIPQYTFKIIRRFPHDPSAFTQGLAYAGGFLYEGTGLNGRSSLRQVRLETGEVLQRVDLSAEFFGEGVCVIKDEIIQLTWRSRMGFIYSRVGLRRLRRFSYSGEGWGITTSGTEVFMSDGTADIRVFDTSMLHETRRFLVHDGNTAIKDLNELEFVRGEIFANVWHTDRIARISPRDGTVVGWIDLTGLYNPKDRTDPDSVLNGIAYDPLRNRLFVTGKLWPSIFEIQLVPKRSTRN
ncbi:MAG TPA: glutaminyl-peptide cyclotransferase [Candidatus Angelobacter sp.]